jgi:hypothetical protein
MHTNIYSENVKGRDHLGDLGYGDVDWIHLAQDEVQWRVLMNTLIFFLVPKRAGYSLTSRVTISFVRRTLLHKVSHLYTAVIL